VNDLEKMKNFYIEKFSASSGSKYYNPDKEFSSYFLKFSSGSQIELMHVPGNSETLKSKSLFHFAISVGDRNSVDKLTDELRSNGVEIISMPRTTGDGYYESVICDPEGNQIEITE
jgi:lactoylglutathione lyase